MVKAKAHNGYDFDRSQHAVYSMQYHLILVVKYRRDVFEDNEITNTLKERVIRVSEKRDVRVLEQGVDTDHIHIIFRADPTTELSKYICSLKTATSRVIRNRHPEVKDKLWNGAFWSPSYCLITTGEVTLDKLQEYVESQGKDEDD